MVCIAAVRPPFAITLLHSRCADEWLRAAFDGAIFFFWVPRFQLVVHVKSVHSETLVHFIWQRWRNVNMHHPEMNFRFHPPALASFFLAALTP